MQFQIILYASVIVLLQRKFYMQVPAYHNSITQKIQFGTGTVLMI